MAEEQNVAGTAAEPPASAGQTPPPAEPDPQEPVDDETYDDILMKALQKIYDGIEEDPGEPPAEGAPPKEPSKPVEEMTLDELRKAFAAQKETLKAVVETSLADREERNAVAVWNEFLEGATPTEAAVAKTMTFEVADKAGMMEQINQVKKVAAATEQLITSEVEKRVGSAKGQLRSQYGIITPEPESEEDLAVQDKKDLEAQNYAAVIARRFRRAGKTG